MGVDGDDAEMTCLCPSHDHLPQMPSYPTMQEPLTQTGQCTADWSQSGIASREMSFERGEGPISYPRVRFFVRQCESRTFLPASIAPKRTIPDLPKKCKPDILPPRRLPTRTPFRSRSLYYNLLVAQNEWWVGNNKRYRHKRFLVAISYTCIIRYSNGRRPIIQLDLEILCFV
jgi:hypothetical protein